MWKRIRKIVSDWQTFGFDQGWWKRNKIDNFDEYLDAFKCAYKWRKLPYSYDRNHRLNKVSNLMAEFEDTMADELGRIL